MTIGEEQKSVRRAGASQFDELLKGEQDKYKRYQGDYGSILDQMEGLRGSMYNTSPQFQEQLNQTLGGMKDRGFQTLSEYYEPTYRRNQQNVASRFGGIQNSVARDTEAEIAKRERDAATNLARDIESQRYNIEGTQLQRQRMPYTDLMAERQYTDALIPQYLNTIGQAQQYAPVEYTVPGTNIGGMAGAGLALGLAPFTGGASLAYLPAAYGAGQAAGNVIKF